MLIAQVRIYENEVKDENLIHTLEHRQSETVMLQSPGMFCGIPIEDKDGDCIFLDGYKFTFIASKLVDGKLVKAMK